MYLKNSTKAINYSIDTGVENWWVNFCYSGSCQRKSQFNKFHCNQADQPTTRLSTSKNETKLWTSALHWSIILSSFRTRQSVRIYKTYKKPVKNLNSRAKAGVSDIENASGLFTWCICCFLQWNFRKLAFSICHLRRCGLKCRTINQAIVQNA